MVADAERLHTSKAPRQARCNQWPSGGHPHHERRLDKVDGREDSAGSKRTFGRVRIYLQDPGYVNGPARPTASRDATTHSLTKVRIHGSNWIKPVRVLRRETLLASKGEPRTWVTFS